MPRRKELVSICRLSDGDFILGTSDTFWGPEEEEVCRDSEELVRICRHDEEDSILGTADCLP